MAVLVILIVLVVVFSATSEAIRKMIKEWVLGSDYEYSEGTPFVIAILVSDYKQKEFLVKYDKNESVFYDCARVKYFPHELYIKKNKDDTKLT